MFKKLRKSIKFRKSRKNVINSGGGNKTTSLNHKYPTKKNKMRENLEQNKNLDIDLIDGKVNGMNSIDSIELHFEKLKKPKNKKPKNKKSYKYKKIHVENLEDLEDVDFNSSLNFEEYAKNRKIEK
jgi:hypothetical protein